MNTTNRINCTTTTLPTLLIIAVIVVIRRLGCRTVLRFEGVFFFFFFWEGEGLEVKYVSELELVLSQ